MLKCLSTTSAENYRSVSANFLGCLLPLGDSYHPDRRSSGRSRSGIHCHRRYDAALERQRHQQRLDGSNLVALATRTQATSRGKRAHHVRRNLAVTGTAHRFPDHSDNAIKHADQSNDPVPKVLLENGCVQYSEPRQRYRAMVCHASASDTVAASFHCPPPVRPHTPGYPPAQHCTQRHQNQFPHTVSLCRLCHAGRTVPQMRLSALSLTQTKIESGPEFIRAYNSTS